MDTRIASGGLRNDVVATDTAARVTPPAGPAFRDVVARGAGAIARGAEAAIVSLPGAPIVAAAVRGGSGPAVSGASGAPRAPGAPPIGTAAGAVSAPGAGAGAAEGPGGTAAAAAGGEAGSVERVLAQTQEFNMYYLQLQEQLSAENRSYSAMSNVLKTRHDTVKNAIGNIR